MKVYILLTALLEYIVVTVALEYLNFFKIQEAIMAKTSPDCCRNGQEALLLLY